jgi:cytochrome c2
MNEEKEESRLEKGKKIFMRVCSQCHSMDPNLKPHKMGMV